VIDIGIEVEEVVVEVGQGAGAGAGVYQEAGAEVEAIIETGDIEAREIDPKKVMRTII